MTSATQPSANSRSLWVMLLALASAFMLSQAYRTVAAIMATPLQNDFHLSAQALGTFAGSFHFAFGAMQLFMGIGIDLHGVRRTVLTAFPIAIAGAIISAMAHNYTTLIVGQMLVGVGCAPAFLVCTVFIARHFPPERFAAVAGITLSLSGIGMLLTGTPLAWLIGVTSWRMGFATLGGLSVVVWLLIWWLVHEPVGAHTMQAGQKKETVREAIGKFGALFLLPHTLGIILLASVCYASFISLRGLWLGPLLIHRHEFSLVQSGNVAVVMSIASQLTPPLFGRFDPGPLRRRSWLVVMTFVLAAVFAVFAFTHSAVIDVVAPVLIGLLSGYMVLQYSDVRSAYPAALTGRALAVFTMAMFLGVAVMQWFTGAVASFASAHGAQPYTAVLATIAALLALGAIAFALLPGPPAPASVTIGE